MVKSGQVLTGLVVCRDSTGALSTPTVGPSGTLYVAGVANGAAVMITGSNPYTWSVTLPTLTAGQSVQVYVTATVAAIATAAIVFEDIGDTYLTSDVYGNMGDTSGVTKLINALVPIAGAVSDTSPTATSFKTNLSPASADDNFYKGQAVIFYGASGLTGQLGQIASFAVTNSVITLQSALTRAPGNGDTFYIVNVAASRKMADWLTNGISANDYKNLISTDVVDLSGTLSVNAKLLGGATPNNLGGTAQSGDAYSLLGTKIPQTIEFSHVGTHYYIAIDLQSWLGVIPAALTATGKFIQSLVARWITDDAAGTPVALDASKYVQSDAMLLNTASPNNLAAGAAMTLTSAYDAAKAAASQASVNAIPTNPLLANSALLPATVIAAKADIPSVSGLAVEANVQGHVTDALNAAIPASPTSNSIFDYIKSKLSQYAGGDTAGTTTLLGRIIGTLLTGNHNPQSGDSFGVVKSGGTGDLVALKAVTPATMIAAKADVTSATPPTVPQIVNGVWDEQLSGHTTTGSAGKYLAASGAASDPLLSPVPGTYPTGTAGAALGHIASVPVVSISSPVATNGDILVYAGDDYYAADGRAIDITDLSGAWPDLTSATVMFYAGTLSKAMTVIVPSGASKKVRLEFSQVETTSVLPKTSRYRIVATLADGHVSTLVEAILTVIQP